MQSGVMELWTVFNWLDSAYLWVKYPPAKIRLFLISQWPSDFVDTVCASWRLPPLAAAFCSMVLVYKCGQKKLNNLYYQVKEQRRRSTWRKTKNLTLRNLNNRLWICIMPEEPRMLVSIRVPPHPCQKSWHYIAGEAYPTQAGHSIGIIHRWTTCIIEHFCALCRMSTK